MRGGIVGLAGKLLSVCVGIKITDAVVGLDGDVGVVGAVMESRETYACTFNIQLYTHVGLVGILPLEIGVIAGLKRPRVVTADGLVVSIGR